MAFIKARILLHIARKNPVVVLGQSGIFAVLLLGASLFDGVGVTKLADDFGKGDFGSVLIDVLIVVVFGLGSLLGMIAYVAEWISNCRGLLRPIGEQTAGWMPLSQEQWERKQAERQPTLF